MSMSFAELFRGRRLRLGGAIAIALAVVLAVVLIVVCIAVHCSTVNSRTVAQEEFIRQVVNDSGVAEDYSLLKVAEGAPGYTLDVSLREDASPEQTGALLHALYEDTESVSKVNLGFDADHALNTTRLDRTREQWSSLVGHVHEAGPMTASFTQLGPTGAATYWLDMTSFAEDPAAEYERIQLLDKPNWLTYGTLELSTEPDSWPALLINAGREVTPEELATFQSLNRELAETTDYGENYELAMHVELGADTAEFEMRIITEPLNHSSESSVPEARPHGHGESHSISLTLRERTERILIESGIPEFVLTIQVDDEEPVLVER